LNDKWNLALSRFFPRCRMSLLILTVCEEWYKWKRLDLSLFFTGSKLAFYFQDMDMFLGILRVGLCRFSASRMGHLQGKQWRINSATTGTNLQAL
jgi:hypothetical protein